MFYTTAVRLTTLKFVVTKNTVSQREAMVLQSKINKRTKLQRGFVTEKQINFSLILKTLALFLTKENLL